jgi:hypothetical protein
MQYWQYFQPMACKSFADVGLAIIYKSKHHNKNKNIVMHILAYNVHNCSEGNKAITPFIQRFLFHYVGKAIDVFIVSFPIGSMILYGISWPIHLIGF